MNHPLSREASILKRSIMRELIARIAHPDTSADMIADIIALSGGLPASELLPVDALGACINAVLSRERGDALQYKPHYPPLIHWITDYMQARGVDCTPDQVFITNGNQQGLTLLSRLFLNPDGVAVTEAVTFTGIHQVTTGRGAEVIAIPTDLQTGIDVDALERAFQAENKPSVAFIIPDFHNPLGVTISREKRERIAQLSAQYSVPIVEDDPYSALRFSGTAEPPIKAFDRAGMVFYMGSFSKMLAPALRLGWMIAPAEFIPRLTVLREALDLESSALIQRATAEFLTQGLLSPHLERMNREHQTRCNALVTALEQYMGDVATWTKPDGGLFVWVTLNHAEVNTWEVLDSALKAGVAFVPGGAFAIHGDYHNTLRLNFSKIESGALFEGVKRLSTVVKKFI